MIKTQGNRRLKVRIRVELLLFYSGLCSTDYDVTCSRRYLDGIKYEEAISDEHPHIHGAVVVP